MKSVHVLSVNMVTYIHQVFDIAIVRSGRSHSIQNGGGHTGSVSLEMFNVLIRVVQQVTHELLTVKYLKGNCK